jgi:hypothetical protein
VPTEKHVSLHYGWTAVDGLGWLLTLVGLGAVAQLVRRGSLEFPPPDDEREDVPEPERGDELEYDLAPV